MSSELFRKEALDAQHFRFESNVVISIPPSLKLVSGGAFLMILIGLFSLWGIKYTRYIPVSGMVISNAGVVKIRSPLVARVLEKRFHNGDHVKKGDIFFVLTAERTSAVTESIEEMALKIAQQRKNSMKTEGDSLQRLSLAEDKKVSNSIMELSNSISALEQQIKIKKEKAKLAHDGEKRHKFLLDEGYVSIDQYQEKVAIALESDANVLESRNQLEKLRSDLRGTYLEREVTQKKYVSQKEQLSRTEMSLDQDILETSAKRVMTIIAPNDGVVTDASVAVGQSVEMQQVLVTVLPDGSEISAELYVPTTAIGFLKVGNEVLLKYDAYPYQKFGQYDAVVSSISPFTLPSSEISSSLGGVRKQSSGPADEAYFVVNARLKKDYVKAYGDSHKLVPGSTLGAEIGVEERRVIDWLLEPLYARNKNSFALMQ